MQGAGLKVPEAYLKYDDGDLRGPRNDADGYFYPLYLLQSSAQAADTSAGGAGVAQQYTFSNTFPNITFYAPVSIDVSGSQTTSNYETYEGNGFIKNSSQKNMLRPWKLGPI